MSEGTFLNSIYSMFVIAIFCLLNYIGCKGQMKQGIKPEVAQTISDTSGYKSEVISPDLLRNNAMDSLEFKLKDGKKDGLRRTFYQNGQLKAEGVYKAGLKEGLHREWEENGILSLEGFYAKGKANGLMKWYHEKGALAGEGEMKDDLRVGKWRICDIQENEFCIEAYFKEDKRDGVWKIYHQNDGDRLWKEQVYEEDMMRSERCWDEDGLEVECE